MKKFGAIFLALCLCLGLCACGNNSKPIETQVQKSSAVVDTENAISSIGEVTIESKDLIETAEALYGNLTDAEKELVSNRSTLILARKQYDEVESTKKHECLIAEKDALIAGLNTAQDKLSFASKYAGNVNGSGKRKFADSFLEELEHCLDNISLTYLEEEIPGISEDVAKIKAGCLAVHDMLVDMGNTNSAKNVENIKKESVDTNKLVTELLNGALSSIE